MTQNLQDAAKAVLRGNFTAIQSYLKKQAKSHINNLNLSLKQLEKEEQKNPKVSRRKEIKKQIKKYLETNDNENMMIQNLWDAAKAIVRGKFIAIQSYLKKQAKSQTNNLTLHLKQLEKEE